METWLKLKFSNFNIRQIAESGQCFRIYEEDGIWRVPAFGRLLKIREMNDDEYDFECTPEEFNKIWKKYFDLELDYGEIVERLNNSNDAYLKKAANFGKGIRILRQDPLETIISFIISQRNNIPRIRNTITKICGGKDAPFPELSELEKYDLDFWRKMGLGYRAEYVYEIIKSISEKLLDLETPKDLKYLDALTYLKQFKGIGDKVANCILLYGYHFTQAFPRDVWINRIIDRQYNGIFYNDHLDDIAGIAQQYMFFYERYGVEKKQQRVKIVLTKI